MGNDQSKPPKHEPKQSAEMPIRSAMSRSRSVRSGANCLEESSEKFPLPSAKEQYTVDPFSSGTSGIDSPQWGWYINTTPPTPEMYYSRPQKSRKPDSTSDTSEASTITAFPPSSVTVNDQQLPKYHPNPVFRGLQDNNRSVPLDWPSVPL